MFRFALLAAVVVMAQATFIGTGAVSVAAPVAVSYNYNNFMGYWNKFGNAYNPWFVGYCNNYMTSHPNGQFLPYVRQYLTTYGGDAYGPTGGAIVGGAAYGPTAPVAAGYGANNAYNFNNFMRYYNQYRTAYNPWFAGYCNSYLTSHPAGKYVGYVRRYLTKYAGPNYGIPAATVATLGSAGIAAVKAFPHENRSPAQRGEVALDYKTPVINNGYGAGAAYNFNNFMGYWKQYNTAYNPWFVSYCNSYLTSHPAGKFVPYVRRYLTSFGGAGYGPTAGAAIVGGDAYGPAGAIFGGNAYGAGPYNFKNFMGYYNQYHGGYSKYFFDYCNNYVQTHPRGQYFTQASKYINQYAGYGPTGAIVGGAAYGPTGAIVGGDAYGPTGAIVGGDAYGPTGAFVGGAAYGPTGGAYNFGDFYNLWGRHHGSYSKYFVNYCNNYVKTHPTGPYVTYANQYLSKFGAGYGPGVAAPVGDAIY